LSFRQVKTEAYDQVLIGHVNRFSLFQRSDIVGGFLGFVMKLCRDPRFGRSMGF